MINFELKKDYAHKIGIYQIRNLVNDKVYIGQTNDCFAKRFYLHDFLLRNDRHDNVNLQPDYNVYGECMFNFEPLYVFDEPFDLDWLEKKCIKEARKSNLCYNISDGGKGALGVPMTEENKRFHAEHNKILNTGKRASNETKRKMSETRRKLGPRPLDVIQKARASKEQKFLEGNYDNKTAKITVEDAKLIKIALMQNVLYEDLAKEFGVSRSNINAIRSNRSWKFVFVPGWEEYCESNKYNRQARQSRGATE